MTLAIPVAGVKCNFVGIVDAEEGGLERGNADSFFFLRVSSSLVNLPDEAGIHLHLQNYPLVKFYERYCQRSRRVIQAETGIFIRASGAVGR